MYKNVKTKMQMYSFPTVSSNQAGNVNELILCSRGSTRSFLGQSS